MEEKGKNNLKKTLIAGTIATTLIGPMVLNFANYVATKIDISTLEDSHSKKMVAKFIVENYQERNPFDKFLHYGEYVAANNCLESIE